jgi:hypothetical protein
LRLLAAPLQVSGTGTLDQPVQFAGETFGAGAPTRGEYKFSNYRLGYRYTLRNEPTWGWTVGATGFVRDARVALSQGGIRAEDTDVGLVPLLHLSAWWALAPAVVLSLEADGLAASQGRAVDVAAAVEYRPTQNWSLALGYRLIEGGADNDDVFSFAVIHHALISARLRF